MTHNEGNEMILRFPREIKIQCMRDALEQDNFGMFMGLSKVFLDAAISEGGIETEVIQAIHDEYMNMRKEEHDIDAGYNLNHE